MPSLKKTATNFKPRLANNPRLQNTLAIAVSLLALIGGYCLLLLLISHRPFSRDILVTNADSLVLPLVRDSFIHHEPFKWIFSSQLFLFPEAPLYFISSLFLANVKAALLLNGLLNIILLWLLIVLIINKLRPKNWFHPLLAAVLVLGLLFLMALERSPGAFGLTQYLTTTYYSGVIIMLFFSIWLGLYTLELSAKNNFGPGRYLLLSFMALVIALAALSDPLYIVWYLLPFLVVVFSGWLINIFGLRAALLLSAPPLLGSGLGIALRPLFKKLLGAPLDSYIKIEKISPSIIELRTRFSGLLHYHYQQLEYFLIVLAYLSLVAGMIALIKHLTADLRKLKKPSDQQVYLLFGFGVIGPLVSIFVIVISGNNAMRYLLPVFIVPVICLVGWLNRASVQKILDRARYYVLAALLIIGLLGVIAGGGKVGSLTAYYPSDAQCLDSRLPAGYRYGVASYWNARSLELTSKKNKRIAQVNPDLTVYYWMNNLADYEHRGFTFVVVDKQLASPLDIRREDVLQRAGRPLNIIHCPQIDVYLYPSGSQASKQLNYTIQSSLRHLVEIR